MMVICKKSTISIISLYDNTFKKFNINIKKNLNMSAM